MSRAVGQNDSAAIAIVGGGAAGLAAAIVAGEALHDAGVGRVVLCEANDRVGRSILATGNGRCNFSNARLTEETSGDLATLEPLYRNTEFVAHALAALEELSLFERDSAEQASSLTGNDNAVLRFFADHGLVWREEGEGRLYPLANKASSVLDVLRAASEAAQVEVLTEFAVRDIVRRSDGGFLLKGKDGRELRAQQVIIAVGGAITADIVASLGLPLIAQRPVLGPLAVNAKDARITKRLDNIRVKAAVTLFRSGERLMREQGEVLFRAYGLSGIAVFDLSREAKAGDEVSLDLLPQLTFQQTKDLLSARAQRLHERSVKAASYGAVLRGMVLPQVGDIICERARVKPDAAYDGEGGERIARELKDLRFTVEGIGDARQCQVERGGIAVSAVIPATLEAPAIPGLYVTGEALDVDAACGGFNLHWAWASGMLAGYMAALAEISAQEESR